MSAEHLDRARTVPELTLITPELPAGVVLARATAALDGVESGRCALQLRARHLPADERTRLGAALRAITAERGVALLVNADLALACTLGADGVQLPERGPSVAAARAALGARALVGASRHDQAGVLTAAAVGASFVLLAPVFEVPGKGAPLGLAAFAQVAAASPVPVIALGGVRLERVRAVLDAGAAGVAVIREVFDAPDPARAAAALLAELARASARACPQGA